MGTIRRFEELECWQAAREFVKMIYGLTGKVKFRKDFELVSQVRRSSVSSMANIAEGFHEVPGLFKIIFSRDGKPLLCGNRPALYKCKRDGVRYSASRYSLEESK